MGFAQKYLMELMTKPGNPATTVSKAERTRVMCAATLQCRVFWSLQCVWRYYANWIASKLFCDILNAVAVAVLISEKASSYNCTSFHKVKLMAVVEFSIICRIAMISNEDLIPNPISRYTCLLNWQALIYGH